MQGNVITQLYSLDEFHGHINSGNCSTAIAIDLSGGCHVTQSDQTQMVTELVTTLITKMQQQLHRLELDFRYGKLGDDGVAALGKLFASNNCPDHVHLDLRHNELTDEQLAILAVGLSTTHSTTRHTIVQLNLGHNNLSDNSCRIIAELLGMEDKCLLEALSIDGNNLTISGPLVIVTALLTNKTSKTLVFGQINCKNATEALHLANALSNMSARNHHLLSLDIKYNYPATDKELEQQILAASRATESNLVRNNRTGEFGGAVKILYQTDLGFLRSMVSEEQRILELMHHLVPLEWHYSNGVLQAELHDGAAELVIALNRVFNLKPSTVRLQYNAISHHLITVNLTSTYQLEQHLKDQHKFDEVMAATFKFNSNFD